MYTVYFIIPFYMLKIKVRHQSIWETLSIKEYWNLIGREHASERPAINWYDLLICFIIHYLQTKKSNSETYPFTRYWRSKILKPDGTIAFLTLTQELEFFIDMQFFQNVQEPSVLSF